MFPFWEQFWCAYEEALRERDARVRKLIPRSTGIESRPLGDATPFHAGRQATEVDPHPSLSNNS
jgi:hypothetical protein